MHFISAYCKLNCDIKFLKKCPISLLFQFTEEFLRRIPHSERPRVIVVADGSCGDTCSVLGISSDYTAESCHAYGANATIERLDQRQVTRTHTAWTYTNAFSPVHTHDGNNRQVAVCVKTEGSEYRILQRCDIIWLHKADLKLNTQRCHSLLTPELTRTRHLSPTIPLSLCLWHVKSSSFATWAILAVPATCRIMFPPHFTLQISCCSNNPHI